MKTIILLTLLLFPTLNLFGLGIAIELRPERRPIPRPEQPDVSRQVVLEKAEIHTSVTNSAAITRIVHTFRNTGNTPAEAQFLYPLPPHAAVSDLLLIADGKELRGEILEQEEARRIYQEIVSRLRDPALLEWAEDQLIRVSMFPIPPGQVQTVEVTYSQPMLLEQGLFQYRVSLKRGVRTSNQPTAPPPVDISITTADGVSYSHSPTHGLNNSSNNSIVSGKNLAGGQFRELIAYFQPDSKEIVGTLDAYRRSGEDGYFMLQITPPAETTNTTSLPLDVIFVIDTSGSMNSEGKLEQAKRAFSYCISQLKDSDRFTLVTFNSTVRAWKGALVKSNASIQEEASDFVANIRASGGTNIAGALSSSVKIMKMGHRKDKALSAIVFLTDGLPTVGSREPEEIISQSGLKELDGIRVFTFGVGDQVNTRLLDQVALDTRAASDYIQPGEDMELPISRFYDKLSQPALTNLELSIGRDDVYDVFPQPLPDLFYGSSLQVFGRYKKGGPADVVLTGTEAETSRTYKFSREFPERKTESQHLEKLWAVRKLGYLLTHLKLQGESPELKDEITELGKKYGLVTPYTSYLAAPEEEYLRADRNVAASQSRRESRPTSRQSYDSSSIIGQPVPAASAPMAAESGRTAVFQSTQSRKMREAVTLDAAPEPEISGKNFAGGRQFTLENGTWVEEGLSLSDSPDARVKFASSAWIHLAEVSTELKEILALGEQVLLKLPSGKTVLIGTEGIDSIEDMESIITQ